MLFRGKLSDLGKLCDPDLHLWCAGSAVKPWVLSELLSLRGGNIRIYFKFVLMFFNTFSLPIPPRPRPDLVSQRTLGAEAMAELVSRQESYYANTGAEEPGYTKTP